MRCWRKAVILALLCGSVVGCNQPAVSLKPPAFQSSENTVRDWNDIAHRIAAELTALGLAPPLPTPGNAQVSPTPLGRAVWETSPPRPVFVRVQAPDSAFVRQVAATLEDDILRRGGIVARTPAGATVVNLDVDFIRWGPRDKPPGLTFTSLGAFAGVPGIVFGDNMPMSTWALGDTGIWASLGYGVLFDTLLAMYPTMNAEAVWKATIVTDDRVVMDLQAPVYIRAKDIPLYAKSTALTPVASWSNPAAPLSERRLPYDP
jgi:hypothetical protein